MLVVTQSSRQASASSSHQLKKPKAASRRSSTSYTLSSSRSSDPMPYPNDVTSSTWRSCCSTRRSCSENPKRSETLFLKSSHVAKMIKSSKQKSPRLWQSWLNNVVEAEVVESNDLVADAGRDIDDAAGVKDDVRECDTPFPIDLLPHTLPSSITFRCSTAALLHRLSSMSLSPPPILCFLDLLVISFYASFIKNNIEYSGG